MKWGTTFFLFIVVVGLFAFINFYEKDITGTTKKNYQNKLALDIRPHDVQYLRIEKEKLRIECKKRDGLWTLSHPAGAKVKQNLIEHILNKLEMLEKGTVFSAKEITKKRMSISDFGLDKPRARIAFGTELTHRTILLGNDTPLGNRLYIKDLSLPDIITVNRKLLEIIPDDPSFLRLRDVFPVSLDWIVNIAIRHPQGFFELQRMNGELWRIQQPRIIPAKTEMVKNFLSTLLSLKAETFYDHIPQDKNAGSFDIPEDSPYITLRGEKEEEEMTLLLGSPVKDSESLIYGRLENINSLMGLPGKLLKIIQLDVDELSNRKLAAMIPLAELGTLSWKNGDRNLRIDKKENSWELTHPLSFKIPEESISSLITHLDEVPIVRFLKPPEIIPYDTTNVVPQLTIRADWEKSEFTDWEIKLFRHKTNTQHVVFQIKAQHLWGVISNSFTNAFSLDPLHFRNPVILSVKPEKVIRITRSNSKDQVTVQRTGSNQLWEATSPELIIATNHIHTLLKTIEELKVANWITLHPKDLVRYGLEKPKYTLAFGFSGTDNIGQTILLGFPARPGEIYAKLLGEDMVFSIRRDDYEVLIRELCE